MLEKKFIFKEFARRLGRDLRYLCSNTMPLLPDAEEEFFEIYKLCCPYTMTSIERMYSLYKAMEYIVQNNIPGDIVECGVYKGGSAMICAHILKAANMNKSLYLYDTYEGMPKPGAKDVTFDDQSADAQWGKYQRDTHNAWCYSALEDVKSHLYSTQYENAYMHFIKGKVEETLPKTKPQQIALLRLDTDWYESTYQELVHLYPLLAEQGVLIIDDYGHWKGAREAVDTYFKENNIKMLLNRIDYTGRIGIKTE